MTPLFKKTLNSIYSAKGLPLNEKIGRIRTQLTFSCFEISDLTQIISDNVDIVSLLRGSEQIPKEYNFLPSDRCYLEWINCDGNRGGITFNKINENLVRVRHVVSSGLVVAQESYFSLDGTWNYSLYQNEHEFEDMIAIWEKARIALSLINEPKITMIDHAPSHKGQVKKLARMTGNDTVRNMRDVGYVRLKLSDPKHAGNEPAAIPGASKRLHFCRAHLRIVRGRQVFVRAHWRGDASKGPARQPTYKVKP